MLTMMKILVPMIMLIPTAWLVSQKWLWTVILTHSLIIAIASLTWLDNSSETGWTHQDHVLAVDPLSAPLMVLTCWLLPLMILASQFPMKFTPIARQRSYLTLLISLQLLILLSFSATDMFSFYIMFEATLVPTLIIITRWGYQPERIKAGTYFLFYTLTCSLPLLMALLLYYIEKGSSSFFIMAMTPSETDLSTSAKMWWAACLIAFLVKIPVYGLHLWLPKAHVEAPIAGSMILAAVLLKLGGYGVARIVAILDSFDDQLTYPFMVLSLWGMVMTSAVCLRQTDMKALIAYSSVGHMGLLTAGLLAQTPWGFHGALMLMVAHGLTSSALFCLANTNYERTNSRILILVRGSQIVLPLMGSWWILAVVANAAVPPLPNSIGELVLVTSVLSWSWWSILATGVGILLSAGYSFLIFLMTQRGPFPGHIYSLTPSQSREHLVLLLHLVPLVLLITVPEFISCWPS